MPDTPIKHSDIIQEGNPYDKAIKGLEDLIKKIKELGKVNKTVMADYIKQINKLNVSTKEGKQKLTELSGATSKVTQLEKERQITLNRLTKELTKAKLLKDKDIRSTIKQTEALKIANRETERTIKAQAAGAKSTNRWTKALGSFQFKFNALGNIMSNFVSFMSRQFVRAIRQAITSITDFSTAVAEVAAISGATDKQLKELTKTARKLGGTTKFTATQILGLQKELAKLGFTTDEILDAQRAILSFSTATGADLSEAAKTAGIAVRAFGLTASETNDAVASMAVATTKSALAFADFETILSTVGPVARSFGFTLEDTIALTGRLRDAGFDASKAATATRNILLNLADANGALAQSLGGPVRGFDELIDGLIELDREGISLADTLELTDKRSVAAFNQFLVAAESARELKGEITDVNQELQDMVDIQLDTLAGDVLLLKSAWQEFILSLSEDGGALRRVVQFLTDAVLQVNNLDLAFRKFNKQTADQLERSFTVLQSLNNKQGTEFQAVLAEFADATEQQLLNMESVIIDRFKSIRNVNAKEAKALFDELVRQRRAEFELAFQSAVASAERIAAEKARIDKNNNAIRIKEVKDVTDEIFEIEAVALDRGTKKETETLKFRMAARKRLRAEEKAEKKKQSEEEKAAEDEKQRKINATFDLANRLTTTFSDIFASQKAKELSIVGDNAEKREEIEKKFARREQVLAIGQAIVDGAGWIIRLGKQLGVAAPPFQIAAAALTAAQIAVMASQQFAEGGSGLLGDEGGMLQGRSHSAGGINLGVIGEAERGEYFGIVNRNMSKKYGNELPGIFDSLNNGAFHEVWGRGKALQNNVIVQGDPYTQKMFELMERTPQIYLKGARIERYPDGRIREING